MKTSIEANEFFFYKSTLGKLLPKLKYASKITIFFRYRDTNTEANGSKQTMEFNENQAADQIYPQLIFQLIDNAKPQPERPSKKAVAGAGG